MVLKFGVLVLLLIIDGFLAKQELPVLPTTNLSSILEQLPHLHRGLFRSNSVAVQRLRSSSFRRSMQSTDLTCEWEDKSEECSLSSSSIKSLLKKSETEFAKIAVQNLECQEKTIEEDCTRETPCAWTSDHTGCEYEDLRRGHEDSPCARAAPVYFDLREAEALCPKQDSRRSCKRMKQCQWDATDATCYADSDSIVFGVRKRFDKVLRVLLPVLRALKKEYRSPRYSHNVTLDEYNDYLLSKIHCPIDVEPLVCDYVRAYITHVYVPILYCHAKYTSADSNCSADDLCDFETSDGCVIDASVRRAGVRAAEKVMLDVIPDGIYKKMRENIVTCMTIHDERSCEGTCIWDSEGSICFITHDSSVALFKQATMNSTDALCDFLFVESLSDCYSDLSERECQRRKHCQWDSWDGCEPKRELPLSVAADEDPTFKRRYQRFKKSCARHTTKEACLM